MTPIFPTNTIQETTLVGIVAVVLLYYTVYCTIYSIGDQGYLRIEDRQAVFDSRDYFLKIAFVTVHSFLEFELIG
jgi:hypothetical protein